MMATAEMTPIQKPGTAFSWGRNDMKSARATEPPSTTEIGMSFSVLRFSVASPAERSFKSRNEARKLSMMVGIAFTRLMIPPAATAPAPM
jgi:hypothetical protein